MMVGTVTGRAVSAALLSDYFRNLVNQFFKVLPMRENNESSVDVYMKSLQVELLGCGKFIPEMQKNAIYLTLLSILQYLIENRDCPIPVVRREVFKAISACKKLESLYIDSEGAV